MHCGNCKHWGDGDGKGYPYDAGHVNYCHNRQISGVQHPSFGGCGGTKSMVIVDGSENHHLIQTRITVGCVLFEQR